MQVLLIRLGLVAATVVLATYLPLASFLTLWVLVVWLAPLAFQDKREIQRLRAALEGPRGQIGELRTDLTLCREYIAFLETELQKVQAQPTSKSTPPPSRTEGHPLFRKVGLDQHCPKWVAEAARREYRKRLHPDGKSPGQKAEAERRFKEMETVFREIWKARGF